MGISAPSLDQCIQLRIICIVSSEQASNRSSEQVIEEMKNRIWQSFHTRFTLLCEQHTQMLYSECRARVCVSLCECVRVRVCENSDAKLSARGKCNQRMCMYTSHFANDTQAAQVHTTHRGRLYYTYLHACMLTRTPAYTHTHTRKRTHTHLHDISPQLMYTCCQIKSHSFTQHLYLWCAVAPQQNKSNRIQIKSSQVK